MSYKVKRGDVWLCDFNPTRGSEQAGKRRPAVILSNDCVNFNAPIVTVAPLTSKPKNDQPTHVTLQADWLPRESIALLEQIRTVSKERISGYLGHLTSDQMIAIDQALEIALSLHEPEVSDGE